MTTRVYLELDEDSETSLYMLPVAYWDVPVGFELPTKGETVAFAVLKPQSAVEVLECRRFEVVKRSMFLQCDLWATDRPLTSNEVTLVLKDLGSTMLNDEGYGALGAIDSVGRKGKLA